MSLPRVTILFSNGNLLQDIAAIDGICGLVCTVSTPALIGKAQAVYSLADAESKGYTAAAEAAMHRHLKEFYAEVAGNQKLWVMGTVNTETMADVLDHTDLTGAVKLISAAAGEIRLLGVAKKPAAGYAAGSGFFDTDVSAAVTAAKTFVEAQHSKLNFLRVLIEGRVASESSATVFQPKTADVDYAGVVLGGSQNDGSASVGTALGRAAKYGAHIKLGKVANGPVALSQVYIGTKPIAEVAALESLHSAGCISFMQHPQKAGFYFGIDRMANTKDYRLLAYGRVVGKAALIAAATYVEELESEVDVDEDGRISELDIKHLEGRLEQQINAAMGDQISGVEVYIDPAQDIINTSLLKAKMRIRPKGYTSFIDVDLGLKAPAAA